MKVGDVVKPFSLKTHTGDTVNQDTFKGKWTVLYFYPKDNTPGCTTESCDFRDNLSAFEGKNAQIFGVSKDSEKSHMNFATKYDLNFPLIVDTEGVLLEMFNAWRLKKMYGREFMGIVRSTFIINPDGMVAKVYDKVKVKGHIEAVLSEIQSLAD